MEKLVEHTYGCHIYMKIMLDDAAWKPIAHPEIRAETRKSGRRS